MRAIYGKVFTEVYEHRNQLRTNEITASINAIKNLSNFARDNGNDSIANRLEEIYVKSHSLYKGRDPEFIAYQDTMSLTDKLEFAESFKGKLMEVFQILAGPTKPPPMAKAPTIA